MRAAGSVLVALCLTACATHVDLWGAYRFDDGRLVSIRPSAADTLRYRVFEDGQSGRLYPDDAARYVSGLGFNEREPVDLVVSFLIDDDGAAQGLIWDRESEAAGTAVRTVFDERAAKFQSDGLELSGRLTLPQDPGPHPAVVLVHGSGRDAATRTYFNGDFLAAHGIATLVYDKRGTGSSKGDFGHDFFALARDVVAAVSWLARQPEIDAQRIGLSGYSQGGWIAPLAASMSDRVSWVIVHYGMVDSPAEEARIETRNELRKRGVPEDQLPHVDELTRAAVAIAASDFRGGWDEFHTVVRKYQDEGWMDELGGTTLDAFVRWPEWVVRLAGPWVSVPGLRWYYDSVDVLESLEIPMAWLIAGEDESAPNEFTIAELGRLRAAGKPYELVVFPGTAHGIVEFQEEDGERVYTRYAPDYFRTEVRFARRFAGLEP